MKQRGRLIACACAWILSSLLIEPARASVEDQVKAAFLLNFAKFIDWPAGSFDSPSAAMHLCLLTPTAVSDTITNALAGKSVGLRPMQVRPAPDTLDDCHIVYARGSANDVTDSLKRLPGHGVLSVYEHSTSLADGAIRLFLEDRRIRFSIDDSVTKAQGLTVSAKLLSVARQP